MIFFRPRVSSERKLRSLPLEAIDAHRLENRWHRGHRDAERSSGNRPMAGANVSATRAGYLQLLGMKRRARNAAARSPGAASEEEVTMIYIRCYQSCSQPAIIPIIIIA